MSVEVHGTWDPAFEPVREVFVDHFRSHPCGGAGAPPEVGASVSVVVDGRTVVDLWAGWADAARTRRWERDTIARVFSCTKSITAMAAHTLADEGKLDYDALVTDHWPEYGQNGKERTTVRQLLSHQAGLARLDRKLDHPGDVWVWDRVLEAFAAMAPQWEPGTAHAYHGTSYGHLVGELICRISGEPADQLIRKRIAGPLGADFFVGLSDGEIARCADLVPGPDGDPPGLLEGYEVLDDYNEVSECARSTEVANCTFGRRSPDYLASNGYSNARSIARIYGAVARGGTLDGVQILSPGIIDQATEPQMKAPEFFSGAPRTRALGFNLANASPGTPRSTGTGYGHSGRFGSLGWGEPEAKMGFGYVMNQIWTDEGDPRSNRLLAAALGCASA